MFSDRITVGTNMDSSFLGGILVDYQTWSQEIVHDAGLPGYCLE